MIIKTHKDAEAFHNILRTKIDKNIVLEVSQKKYVEDINDKQRKLWWVWLGHLGSHVGYEKDELYEMMKEQLMLEIFLRENVCGYAEVGKNLAIIKRENIDQYWFFRKRAIHDMSIMDLNKVLMAELLTSLQTFARDFYNFILQTFEDQQRLLSYEENV